MNNKQCKRLRKSARLSMPDNEETVYREINHHQKTFVLPFGTHVEMNNPKIHKIITPPVNELDDDPVMVAVDCAIRIVDACQRKSYMSLKRDFLTQRRGGKVNNA